MRKISSFFLLILLIFISISSAQTLHLPPLTTFGPNGDGSLRPGDRVYLTSSSSPTERGMACNPITGHVLIVSRSDQNVYIIDGATGADIGTLDMSALSTGGNATFRVNLIGIGDDGGIYVANLSNTDFPPVYNLYHWASETNAQELVFNGTLQDVSNGHSIDSSGFKRYGDTMAVRGAGTNTQVLIASRGTNAAILRPSDEFMTNFNSTVLFANVPAGDIGFGLAFGASNTFYATPGAQSGGPLRRLSFDLGDGTNGTATVLQTFYNSNFPGTVSALMVNVSSNLLAGVDVIPGADLVRLYDISNPTNTPVFLDRASFVTTNDNGQTAAALAFGTNGVLYALDANNGIMAFNLVPSTAPVAPSVFLQPLDRVVGPGVTITFTAAADGTLPLSYQWMFNETNVLAGATNASLTITNVQPFNAGLYALVVTNVAGSATSAPAVLSVSTLIAYEPFNYINDGQTITNQSSWFLTTASSSDHAEEGNLTIPLLEPPRTNRLTWGTVNMSLRLPLGVSINSGAIYYSFALRVDDLGSGLTITGDTLGGFTIGTTTTFGTKLNLRTTGTGGYNLGTSRAGTSPIVWAPTEFTTSDTVFVVGRYTFVSGSANDVAEVWLNPDPASFGAASPPPATITNATGTDNATIDRFFVRASGTVPPKKTIDELRIGLSWASVTPPGALLSIVTSGTNAIISWPTKASGYSLQQANNLSSLNWTTVTNPVVVSGANNTVTVTNTGTAFFRLIK